MLSAGLVLLRRYSTASAVFGGKKGADSIRLMRHVTLPCFLAILRGRLESTLR